MKNLGTRVFAFMLLVWYCLSIIGFGVHTCSESNRSFLTSFISGIACDDIHPSDRCNESCCSAKKHKECTAGDVNLNKRTCCQDNYQQIQITGAGQGNSSEEYSIIASSCFCYSTLVIDTVVPSLKFNQVSARSVPHLFMGELRPFLSIWRI